MSKKKTSVISVVILSLLLIIFGISITAQPERDPNKTVDRSFPDTWYQRKDIEQTKEISITEETNSKTESTSPNSTNNTENKTDQSTKKELTYLATDGSEKDYPLDIYVDEDKNQFRYNENDEIDTYRHGYNETFGITTGDLTKEQALEKTKQFIAQLYGDRIKGFELVRCEAQPSGGGYFVDFAKKYGVDGFIAGAKCRNAIQQNGEFSYCTLSNDLFKDFDSKSIESLTQEQVLKEVVSNYVADNPEIAPSSITMTSADLIRQDNGFALQVLISYPDPQLTAPNYVHKDICYYEFNI